MTEHVDKPPPAEASSARDTNDPTGDIEFMPGRALSLRRAVLAGLSVTAVAYAASVDLASYTISNTTCCG
jgi:hypothetical protein